MKNPNVVRAARAAKALKTYYLEGDSLSNDREDREEKVTDLLTDLMHFCGRNEISFARSVEMAQIHFEAETENPDGL